MSVKLSIQNDKACQTHETKWDSAIKDAANEIQLLSVKKARLELAVKIFKENKRDGVPWPGEGKNNAGTR